MNTLIIGDSHCGYFDIPEEIRSSNNNFRGVHNHVLSIPGATINGFGKRNSTLNVNEKITNKYESLNPNYLCFALGQVDIELGFFYKTLIKNEEIRFPEFAKKTVDTYIKSIVDFSKNQEHPLENICVKGVNLPALVYNRAKCVNYTLKIITENIIKIEDINEHKKNLQKHLPSSLELNRNHILFNNELKNSALEYGIKYFDINTQISDKKSGLLHKKFVPSKYDHHIIDSLYVKELHINSLIKAFFS